LAGALRAAQEKEREQLAKVIANSERQLNDEKFMSKAPTKVIDTLRSKLADYEAQLKKIDDALHVAS
jgi:valyl-tRNA synthetase